MAAEEPTVSQSGVAAAASDVGGAPPSGQSPPLDMEVETPDPSQNSNHTETASLETTKRGRKEEDNVGDEKASAHGDAKRARVEEISVEEQRLKVMSEGDIAGREKEDESAREGEGDGVQGDEGVKGGDEGEGEEGTKAKKDEEKEMEKEGTEGTEVEDRREENVKECEGSEEDSIKSESVKLGTKTFSSSVDMFNYFYKFLHFWPLNIDINKYEHMIFLDLLKKGSLEAEKKMGCGVQSFQIRVHPVWKSRCFFVMRTDGSFDDFSYRKAIDNILPLPENMKVPAKADVDKALAGKKPAAHRQGGGGGGRGSHGRGRGRYRK